MLVIDGMSPSMWTRPENIPKIILHNYISLTELCRDALKKKGSINGRKASAGPAKVCMLQ